MQGKLISIAIVSLIFSGCASVSVHDPLAIKQNGAVPVYYCVESTAQMNILDKALTKEKNEDKFAENRKLSLGSIDGYVNANMIKSPYLLVKELPSCQELAATLPDSPTALYLTITLSGYGSLNERWKKIFIGSGIIEGVVQGVVVATATQNPWLGVAVAAEEFGQEYLTWNGIDWLMGETYAPVTLEGRLVSSKDSQIIWKDSSFITENSDELKSMSEGEKKNKDVQLQASLHEAEKELVSSLNTYLREEILKRQE